ncbi:MAG: NYN domain-containing protein [Desulfobacterales bacterium]|nr:MAG: NYN domain-containing protein [Desulfobacterales bacterium]
MSLHIIIDGYNLIRQSSRLSILDLQDIQLGREALVDMLAAYKKFKAHRITVVFDGTGLPLVSRQRDRQKGITIVYSHNGESADAVIKKMARREGPKALVVSSDQDIVRSVAAWGVTAINARDFESKLVMSRSLDGMQADGENHSGWKPTTKKKGPRRRLPKRQRKNRAKLGKL